MRIGLEIKLAVIQTKLQTLLKTWKNIIEIAIYYKPLINGL